MLAERVEQWNRELIEKGRLEGWLEGWFEGRQEGLLEGEARVLARLLTQRFGPLPDWVAQHLARAGETELNAVTDALLNAESLAALFEDIEDRRAVLSARDEPAEPWESVKAELGLK